MTRTYAVYRELSTVTTRERFVMLLNKYYLPYNQGFVWGSSAGIWPHRYNANRLVVLYSSGARHVSVPSCAMYSGCAFYAKS
jgi:hypothetical protein